MKIVGIDHVQLAMPAGGEADARAFYGELLSLTEIAKPAELLARGGAWFQCGDLQIHLGIENGFRPARKAHPALRVEGYAELVERLARSGFEVISDTAIPGVTRGFAFDPFGNRIELISV